MKTDWFLIQYTQDLRRKEAKNVGIAVRQEKNWGLRMLALNSDGTVDGRRLRSLRGIDSVQYKAWVDYIQNAIKSERWDDALVLHLRRPTQFSILSGGALLGDVNVEQAVRDLFAELVDQPKSTVKSPSEILDEKIKSLFREAEIKPDRDVAVDAAWKGLEDNGYLESKVNFGYAVRSDATTFLDKVALTSHNLSQSSLQARDFHSRATAVHLVDPRSSFAAFYSGSFLEEERELDELLRPIEAVGTAINVDDRDSALEYLSSAA